MEYKKGNRYRRQALEENKTLNKNPDKVLDTNFKNIEFFDPNDILQVKYEMLRYSEEDGVSVLNAAKTYGFSRISFYKIKKAFKEDGLAGLFPEKRGPRRAHKMGAEVMEFTDNLIKENPHVRSSEIKEKIMKHFNITVHERSIERAIKRGKKKQQNI
jgi:transposase